MKILVLILIFNFQACSNLPSVLKPMSSSGTGGDTSTGTSNTNTSLIVLSNAILDPFNPSTTLDLLDNGTQSIGRYCTASNNQGSSITSTSPTVCECNFQYNLSTGSSQQIYSSVTYHEQDMVRCSYTMIPNTVTSIQVSLHLINLNTDSNTITLNTNGSSGYLDLSNPASYTQPVRYQCRDVVTIPYFFDSSIYDPFQSEDPHKNYPIDFYTSNIVASFSNYIANSNPPSWNCPSILDPQNSLDPSILSTYYTQNQINLNVYSVIDQPGGGKMIYPPNGTVDRSTFYLATQKAGAFTVPVNAVTAPNVITSSGSQTAPPLGYGALPLPLGSSGSGQETCDTSITIPSGYHFMKLWQFRAGLQSRNYAYPTGLASVQAITCNPGTWPAVSDVSYTVSSSVYPQCASNTPYSLNTITSTGSHYLSSRILSSGECIDLDDGNGLCSTGNASHPGINCTTNPDTSDQWVYNGSLPNLSIPQGYGCTETPLIDPLGVCTKINGSWPSYFEPTNAQVTPISLDVSSNSSNQRFDYLFVVTPTSVMSSDMLNTSGSISQAYTPYRFLTYSDCQSPDPDNPAPGDCLKTNAITTYGLTLVDINNAGDPPGNSIARSGAFPVCVLQPDAN